MVLSERKKQILKRIVEDYKPEFASKAEYLAYLDSLNDSGDRIVYEDGAARVRL